MSCSKPSANISRHLSNKTKWYHPILSFFNWILFFIMLAAYGAMMGVMVYFLNGGFVR